MDCSSTFPPDCIVSQTLSASSASSSSSSFSSSTSSSSTNPVISAQHHPLASGSPEFDASDYLQVYKGRGSRSAARDVHYWKFVETVLASSIGHSFAQIYCSASAQFKLIAGQIISDRQKFIQNHVKKHNQHTESDMNTQQIQPWQTAHNIEQKHEQQSHDELKVSSPLGVEQSLSREAVSKEFADIFRSAMAGLKYEVDRKTDKKTDKGRTETQFQREDDEVEPTNRKKNQGGRKLTRKYRRRKRKTKRCATESEQADDEQSESEAEVDCGNDEKDSAMNTFASGSTAAFHFDSNVHETDDIFEEFLQEQQSRKREQHHQQKKKSFHKQKIHQPMGNENENEEDETPQQLKTAIAELQLNDDRRPDLFEDDDEEDLQFSD